MTLGLNPPAEYPSYTRSNFKIGASVIGGSVAVMLTALWGIHASYERHYNSETCTAFRASAEAQVMRDIEGPSTVYKVEPTVIIDGWHCKLK